MGNFGKVGVGVGNFGKVGVGVGVRYFISDSATVVTDPQKRLWSDWD